MVCAPPGPTAAKPWFCEVISTRPVCRSLTGWFAPWWPNGSLNVSRPTARQSRRGAGAVGQEDRIGILGEQPLGRRGTRVERHAGAALDELAHHRGLDPG